MPKSSGQVMQIFCGTCCVSSSENGDGDGEDDKGSGTVEFPRRSGRALYPTAAAKGAGQ